MRKFVLLAAAMCSAPAMAVTGTPAGGLQEMREINLIVLGTLTTDGQEVEGRTFAKSLNGSNNTNFGIGNTTQGSAASSTYNVLDVVDNATGNFRLKSGYQNGPSGIVGTTAVIGGNADAFDFNDAAGHTDSARLIVGGNLNGGGNVNNHFVTYGGTLGGGINNAVHDTSLAVGGANDVHAAQQAKLDQISADVKSLSDYLAALTPLSTITSTSSALNYSGATGKFAVFNITESAFEDQNANFDNLFTSTPAGFTTVINVLGTNLVEQGNVNSTALNQSVIWNFNQASNVSLKGFHGSVLAPYAAVTNSSAIEGSIVAASFSLHGEVHLGTFAGDVPYTGAVPEPASWAMMLVGFGAVGGMVRSRRRVRIAA